MENLATTTSTNPRLTQHTWLKSELSLLPAVDVPDQAKPFSLLAIEVFLFRVGGAGTVVVAD